MDKEYAFDFPGTKEDFINDLDPLRDPPDSGSRWYYFDEYIVEVSGEEIRFGIARGGHSGGYWFVPAITELGDRTEFRGKIRYIGPAKTGSTAKKVLERIELFLLAVLILPFALMVRFYLLLERLVRKLCNRPKPKEMTEEEKLFDLMENYLGCTEKGSVKEEMPFPVELDGAQVLYYTPRGSYGAITYLGGEMADAYCYLAICKYPKENLFYLFSCNENHEVVSDWPEDSVVACKRTAASSYQGRIIWKKMPLA